MKPDDMLELLPVRPEDIPKIATIKNKPTLASIKAFQEIIQDQATVIATCDHNLGFLVMVLWASYFNPLNNKNSLVPPTYTGPAPINAISIVSQITEVIHLYQNGKYKFTHYCAFYIILIYVITNNSPEKYMNTLKHCIAKICQCEPLNLLTHLYSE